MKTFINCVINALSTPVDPRGPRRPWPPNVRRHFCLQKITDFRTNWLPPQLMQIAKQPSASGGFCPWPWALPLDPNVGSDLHYRVTLTAHHVPSKFWPWSTCGHQWKLTEFSPNVHSCYSYICLVIGTESTAKVTTFHCRQANMPTNNSAHCKIYGNWLPSLWCNASQNSQQGLAESSSSVEFGK